MLLVLQASESLVRAIPPAPDLSWFAGDAVRALYAAGTPSEARIWVKMLQSSARPGTPEDRVLNGVWALAQIGDSFAPPPADPRRFQDWMTNTRSTGGGDPEARITLMIALLEALGLPSPGVDVQAVLGGAKAAAQARAGVQWWQTVEQASRAGRRGETVLAALLALGEAGPGGSQSRSLGRIDPYIAGVIVAGLRRVGLDADARAIALDIALSAGL